MISTERATILREVSGVDSIVDDSVSFVPLLVVVLLEVVVGRVDREVANESLMINLCQ